jgi:hypothetical protein
MVALFGDLPVQDAEWTDAAGISRQPRRVLVGDLVLPTTTRMFARECLTQPLGFTKGIVSNGWDKRSAPAR